ncbi:MAG: hypothetical protein CMB64_02655 [Euryarchaeota archaeon]|nr:hypothetical protein [Euryarchaeota archaeon]|tara:strand:- start:747 stop:1220 length:474 start_codon:yes stop_codon:yes gene_type:complete
MEIEWEPLNIDSNDIDSNPQEEVNFGGLSVSPEVLHSNFYNQADHLSEAIANNNMISDITSEIPENTKYSQKMISVESFANEFNGSISKNRLQLPFRGIQKSQLKLEFSKIESTWGIKLSINSIETDSNSLIRTFLLPESSIKPKANWNSNQLSIVF